MAYKVYVGSMSRELRDIRPIVIQQIQRMGMVAVSVDDNKDDHTDIVERAHHALEEADCYIGVLAYRRGWQPSELGGKSLAEAEYDWALEYNKAAAVLMPKEGSPIAIGLRLRVLDQPPDKRAAQNAFTKRVMDTSPVYWFMDEADLSKQITDILGSWAAKMQAAVVPTPERDVTNFTAPSSETDLDALADKIAVKAILKFQEIQKQREEDIAKQALELQEALRLQPGELVFGRPSTSSQFKSDIFMIMPFDEDFNTVYRESIIPAVTGLNLSIKRGDDFTSSRGSIMEEVWAALNACRIVIAEISIINANVYYELGIAHTLNKPAVMITQATEPEDVPFDIRHLRYIVYENTPKGRQQLQAQLANAITLLLQDLEEGWGPPG